MSKYDKVEFDNFEECMAMIKNIFPNAKALRFQYSRLPEPRYVHLDDGSVTIGAPKKGVCLDRENCYYSNHPEYNNSIVCIDVSERETVIGSAKISEMRYDGDLDAFVLDFVVFCGDGKANNRNGVMKVCKVLKNVFSVGYCGINDLQLGQMNPRDFIDILKSTPSCEVVGDELHRVCEAIMASASPARSLFSVIDAWQKCARYNLFDYIEDYTVLIQNMQFQSFLSEANSFAEAIGVRPEFLFLVDNRHYWTTIQKNLSLISSLRYLGEKSMLSVLYDGLTDRCRRILLEALESKMLSIMGILTEGEHIVHSALLYAECREDFFCDFLKSPEYHGFKPLTAFIEHSARFDQYQITPSVASIRCVEYVALAEYIYADRDEFLDACAHINDGKESVLKVARMLRNVPQ